ncbi:MAG TPA: HYR domain-containing protein [Polyangia bacterium]|nr:HYR domain-containing protein [Polyangia bacterium]
MRRLADAISLFVISAVLLSCSTNAPVDMRRAELDFSTGDVKGTVSWNGAPLTGLQSRGVGAYILGLTSGLLDAGGSYHLSNVRPGTYTVIIFSPGCSEVPAEKLGETSITISAGITTTADVDITSTAGLVTGSIASNGTPVASPAIIIDGVCSSSAWSSDDNGQFAHFTAPGSYTAQVRGGSALLGSLSLTVIAGQQDDLGQVDFLTGDVKGTISWNGAPLGGLRARGVGAYILGLTNGLLDAGGSYHLPNVLPGAYTLIIFSPGCSEVPAEKLGEAAITVTAGATTTADVDITATAGLVTGSITSNGVPVPSPTIIIDGVCSSSAWSSDDTGQFAHFTAPGSYTAQVRGGSALLGSLSLTVIAGQQDDLGPVDFLTGDVKGTVLWNGAPLGGLQARGVGAYILGLTSGLLDNGGSYHLPNVLPGAYTLIIFSPGCSEVPAEKLGEAAITVSAGTTTTADVDITATAGLVTGSITSNGVPVPSPTIIIDGVCSSSAWSSDDSGHFAHFTAPGAFSARVSGDSTFLGSFSFGVVAGKTTDVDILTTPAGTDVVVDLSGGIASVNGMSLDFTQVTTAGSTTVVESGACSPACNPPPTGYEVVGARFWDISTTAAFTGPIQVCIHYDHTEVTGDESALRLVHDDGSGFANITTSLDITRHIVCGSTNSLSPFAVVQPKPGTNTPPVVSVPGNIVAQANAPGGATVVFTVTATDAQDSALAPSCSAASGSTFPIGTTVVTCTATDSGGLSGSAAFTVTVVDTTAPVMGNIPAAIVAYATSTKGAKVTYTKPTARDAVDGTRPVTCTPASGAAFRVGKSTVTCTAADKSGNPSSATFTVWVQYQAPADGTFFLAPIRADGGSIFRIGRPVSVRFKLTGASTGITNLVARLIVTRVSSAVQGSTVDTSDETDDDTDFIFKYRPGLKLYVYRWKTSNQSQGTYRLNADLGDDVVHQVNVSLKAAK